MLAKELANILLEHSNEEVILRCLTSDGYEYFKIDRLDYTHALTTHGYPLKICFSISNNKEK